MLLDSDGEKSIEISDGDKISGADKEAVTGGSFEIVQPYPGSTC